MSYTAPLNDLLFNLEHIAQIDTLATTLPAFAEAGLDTAAAVLEECAKLTQEMIAPLNKVGDQQPSEFQAGKVVTTPGFKVAFTQFTQGGWQGLQHPTEYGGQGLPKTIAAACIEMLNSANLSFALCPMLTDGAIEALLTAGSAEQKEHFIPRLISGEWTGTMNLTEPQAGSDLSLIRTRAEPQADGTYKIFGTKIYITYGEHDMTDNIIHFVLARIQGAPEGVRGISLFIVPKIHINADGSLGERNDVHCVSLEHKLGIKASPTAVLQFGDQGGAIGQLIGQPHRGLETMFIMMNAARYAVGVQGLALSERATQQAVQYAKDRVQSRPVDGSAERSLPIIHHPDVRRMLMHMRATTQACRALALYAAAQNDVAHHHPDPEQRAQHQARYEYLVPIVKGYSTETSQTVASLGVQVHGGMGFIEETGAAQHYRDAKILTIYEGTTAIQANDLIGRKTLRDQGQAAKRLLQDMAHTHAQLLSSTAPAASLVAPHLQAAQQALSEVVEYVLQNAKSNPNAVFAGSVPYLMLAGNALAGWQMAQSLLAAHSVLQQGQGDAAFLQAKIITAQYFAEHILPQALAFKESILHGSNSVLGLAPEAY